MEEYHKNICKYCTKLLIIYNNIWLSNSWYFSDFFVPWLRLTIYWGASSPSIQKLLQFAKKLQEQKCHRFVNILHKSSMTYKYPVAFNLKHPSCMIETPFIILETPLRHFWDTLETVSIYPWNPKNTIQIKLKYT